MGIGWRLVTYNYISISCYGLSFGGFSMRGGLVLNAALGWWWADSLAALVMVPILVKEGWDAIRGKHCDDCHP